MNQFSKMSVYLLPKLIFVLYNVCNDQQCSIFVSLNHYFLGKMACYWNAIIHYIEQLSYFNTNEKCSYVRNISADKPVPNQSINNWIAPYEVVASTLIPSFFLTMPVSVFHFLSLFLVPSVSYIFLNVKKSVCIFT